MGAQELWSFAHKFEHVGVTSVKPRLGSNSGSRCEHHYVTHIKETGTAVAYANLTHRTAVDIFERIGRFEVRCERNRAALAMLKATPRCECNALHLWTPRGNPNDRKGYYIFPKTHKDAAIFEIFFTETSPTIWNEERIGQPVFSFFKV